MTNAFRRRLAAPDLAHSEFVVGRTKDRPAGRNANETRLRILDAAVGEFAAKGLAGARIDQIAVAAQCNKSLIFVYFESKAALFTTVVEKQFERICKEIVFTPQDLPAFAEKMFDFAMKNPESMRLLAWYGLEHELDASVSLIAATRQHEETLQGMRYAGELKSTFPSDFLVAAIVTLCMSWSPTGLIRGIAGLDRPELLPQLRAHVAEAARRLTG